ncbi:MAG: Crp/Fnr family transcriptional regulator [Gammaproteobacteria bacterium]
MKLTVRAVLKANRLFKDLPDAALDKLAALSVRRAVRRGIRIFAQGDPGDSLLGLISGQVRISAASPGGKQVFLNIMEAGESFGEIAVLDGHARTASAEALVDTELFVVRRTDLVALIGREPKLAAHFIALLCQRLRWTSELIEEAAFLPVTGRLTRRLLKLAGEHGTTSQGVVTLRISQGDLAGFMGVSRQIVNQYLQDWRKRGWIELGRGRITITNPAGLRSVLDAPD